MDISRHTTLFGNAGYRYATIGDLKFDGSEVTNQNGGDYQLDYNGVLIRFGFKVTPQYNWLTCLL